MKRTKLYFSAAMVICILVGSFLIWKNYEEISSRFGEALFLAGILGSTVDLFVKKRLATDVATHVSPFIVGHWLPSQIQEEARVIQRIELFRKNLILEYKLTPNGDKLEVTTCAKYVVENLTYEKKSFLFRVAVQVPKGKIINVGVTGLGTGRDFNLHMDDPLSGPEAHVSGPLRRCWYDMFKIGKHIFRRKKNRSPVDQSAAGQAAPFPSEVFKRLIEIPRLTNNRNEEITFWWETRQILTQNDTEVFYFTEPTLHATVNVDYPPEYSLTVSFGHRNSAGAIPIPPEHPRTWLLDAAFLPWQSIMVDWRLKE